MTEGPGREWGPKEVGTGRKTGDQEIMWGTVGEVGDRRGRDQEKIQRSVGQVRSRRNSGHQEE